jgi:phage regulator Rha-like protein
LSGKSTTASSDNLVDSLEVLPIESIALRIMLLRSKRVILDSDLAIMYDVSTKRFNEAVKRNLAKFPDDFMFQLNDDEFASLRSQSATLKNSRGQHRKYAPYAFTEHGAIMAATILSSPRAVQVSVYVVRAFVQLRELSLTQQDIATQLAELDDKIIGINVAHNSFSRNTRIQIKKLFDALSELTNKPDAKTEPAEPPLPATPKRPIGFIIPEEPSEPKTKATKRGKRNG